MKSTRQVLIKAASLFIVFSFLLPVIKVGGVGFKPDLIALVLVTPFLLLTRKIHRFKITKRFKFIAILLLFTMAVSNNFGAYRWGPSNYSFLFPTEYLQIFSRVGVFFLFIYVGNFQVVTERYFIKFLSVVFLIGLIWGTAQFLGIGFVNKISVDFYALTGKQQVGFERANVRGFGTAGNIITWGGLCCIIFYFYYFLCDYSRVLKVSGCLLSIANIAFSASRASMIALLLSFLLVFLLKIILERNFVKTLRTITSVVIGITVLYLIAIQIIPDRISYIESRFTYAERDMTEEGRGRQIAFFFHLFSQDSNNFLFGIGKPVLNDIDYLEVEPAFLFIAYGVVGVLLHYLLVYYYYRTVWETKEISKSRFLFLFSIMTAMLIFSLGFFFFREPYSGMLFWSLAGYFLGCSMREQTTMLSFKK